MGILKLCAGIQAGCWVLTVGRFWHNLGTNKTRAWPRNYCFVDTETCERKINTTTKRQRLRLGVAHYDRDAYGGHSGISRRWDFRTPAGFWGRLIRSSEQDRRLIVVAYNMGFDFRILSGFKVLMGLGYKPQKLFLSSTCVILHFLRGKHRITILDMMNYLEGTLESWGDLLGIAKIEVDFASVSDDKLLKHCNADVDILREVWRRWRDFVSVNDLGHFCPTRAAQALTAFRHRFMPKPMLIHASKEATEIERASYFGGRTECFHVGKLPGPPFFKLDVNSMYPAIMRKVAVPIKFLRIVEGIGLSRLYRGVRRCCLVAEVFVKTRTPCYPYRSKVGMMFPVGEFWTTLATPELAFALAHKHVKAVGRVCVYDSAVMFRRYVDTLYKIRRGYRSKGDDVFQEMVKYLLNSLYGKFGQRNEVWRYDGHNSSNADGAIRVFDLDTGEWVRQYTICGRTWSQIGKQEAYHSFPAVSSHITSAARMLLWRLICMAGRKNVFYCDTDSLIVNRAGRQRLKPYLDDTALGRLKLEYKTDKVTIHSPKDYQTGRETHIKGVRKDAEKIGPNTYKYWEWEGLLGAAGKGNLDSVVMRLRRKVLARTILQGQVSSSGAVSSPVVLDSS